MKNFGLRLFFISGAREASRSGWRWSSNVRGISGLACLDESCLLGNHCSSRCLSVPLPISEVGSSFRPSSTCVSGRHFGSGADRFRRDWQVAIGSVGVEQTNSHTLPVFFHSLCTTARRLTCYSPGAHRLDELLRADAGRVVNPGSAPQG